MRYRKKPIVIEAIRFKDEPMHKDQCPAWLNNAVSAQIVRFQGMPGEDQIVKISAPEGIMIGLPGDWIIQGIKGEIYLCRNDISEATYEEAE